MWFRISSGEKNMKEQKERGIVSHEAFGCLQWKRSLGVVISL